MANENGSADAALKAHLHRAFDGQIPNFGSYNLVYAAGRAGSAGIFVLGYRRQPLELLVAPLDGHTLAARGPAVAVDLTNLSHIAQPMEGGYEIGTTTGRVYRFDVASHPLVDTAEGTRVQLEQDADAEDFAQFMDEFMAVLDGYAGDPQH
ncbi:hypothetical protein NCCP1664_03750 [Zafaria cholistanensis]|uniref:Uncharacterized protein n=1 Tax=Zafaria cholistanensis TaxID=1682741 RepID=A0A5A7NQ01_9MICC|nr:hypothetical protein [Zafaria cholistanensis]GER21878.1 hypothetical protein NCCP1664_03750 [Zafaria cholistanensis]